ncbi:MAG TPA: hypothetical protein VKD46_05035 [bacterium]|nr:hypothetical protein [bacterium]
MVISRSGVRVESTHPDKVRRYILTSAVLAANLALALAPAVIGLLALFGVLG